MLCIFFTQEGLWYADIVLGLGAHEPPKGDGPGQGGEVDEDDGGKTLRVQPVLGRQNSLLSHMFIVKVVQQK